MTCNCVYDIQNSTIPDKVFILKCRNCGIEYTLYPNGEIIYNAELNSNCIYQIYETSNTTHTW